MAFTRTLKVAGAMAFAPWVIAEDAETTATTTIDPMSVFYEGNAVPGRNVPPMPGCTAKGKTYDPITPRGPNHPWTKQNGWDWCQHYCNLNKVTDVYGTIYPCKSWAFFPDGRCYLQGVDTKLVEASDCNSTHACDHDFEVITGPPDCNNVSSWIYPPQPGQVTPAPTTPLSTPAPVTVATTIAAPVATTVAPTEPPTLPETTTEKPKEPKIVGMGEKCNGSIFPGTLCAEGLNCLADVQMPGAWGICTQPTTTPADKSHEKMTTTLPTVPPPPVMATLPSTEATTPAPIAPATTIQVVTVATTVQEVTTADPLAGATLLGYYYEPTAVKTPTPDWRSCAALCASNVFCQNFGYWPDGLCHQQHGDNITFVKAICPEDGSDCPGSKVISGPRDLTDKSLWPNPALAVSSSHQTDKEVTVITDTPPVVAPPPDTTHNREVEVHTSGAGSSGWGPLLIGLLAFLVVGCGAFAAYQKGVCSDNYGESDEEEYDEEEAEDSDMKDRLRGFE